MVLTLSLYASLTRKQKASEIRVIFLMRELYEQILTSTDAVSMMAKIINKKHRDCLKITSRCIFNVIRSLKSGGQDANLLTGRIRSEMVTWTK